MLGTLLVYYACNNMISSYMFCKYYEWDYALRYMLGWKIVPITEPVASVQPWWDLGKVCTSSIPVKEGEYLNTVHWNPEIRCMTVMGDAVIWLWNILVENTRWVERENPLCNYNKKMQEWNFSMFGFQFTFPSKTVVELKFHKWGPYHNMYITPSSADYENTEGLCGYINSPETAQWRMRDGSIHDPCQPRRDKTVCQDFMADWYGIF